MEGQNTISKINSILGKILNLNIVLNFPRHSIRFAKKYFRNKPITVIEIGTYEGENALSMLKMLNIRKLYLIDPYREYSDYLNSEKDKTQQHLSKVEKSARKRLSKYKNKIIWIKDCSDNAVKKIKEKVDFVYIDGNHNYEFVKKDMENYYRKLKKSGILAGHDIASNEYGGDVFRALSKFSQKNKLKPFVTRTDWWLIKNGKGE